MDAELCDPPAGPVHVISHWRFTHNSVTLEVALQGPAGLEAEVSVPVIAAGDAPVVATAAGARIAVAGRSVDLAAEPSADAEMPLAGRVYNHVPGFEAIPWRCRMRPDRPVRLRLTVI